ERHGQSGGDAILDPLLSDTNATRARDALAVRLAGGADGDATAATYVDGRYNKFRAHLDVADAFASLGRFDPAARALREASRVTPTEPVVFEELARAEYYRGDFERAVRAVDDAARRRSDRVGTLVSLARAFAEGPDSGIAASALRRAAERSPGDGSLQIALARQYYLAGDEDAGDEWAERFVDNSDAPTRARAMVIEVLLEANQVDRAL